MAPPSTTTTELIDDVTAEILLLLPPDEPEHLFRAALVCKPWLRILCDPAFLRRYRAYHGAPPLLGFIHRFAGDLVSRLASTTSVPAFTHPGSDGRGARAFDCRHGRVLMSQDEISVYNFLVWNPVSGDRRRCVPVPDIDYWLYSAAVLCAADGCDHLDCHDGPFRLVLAGRDTRSNLICACVYSSETCTWSTPVSLDNSRGFHVRSRPGALVNDEIYFTFSRDDAILKYDWGNNWLSMVKTPVPRSRYYGFAAVMTMVDGSLGLGRVEDSSLYLWSRKVNSEGDAEWILCRVIELETVMPIANLSPYGANVVAFADGVDVIFLGTNAGLFTIELKSGRVRMFGESWLHLSILPYMSFYTPDRGTLLSLARTL
ncbi:hypothetical protein SETIT_2G024000v2 [Setaria italica]|uniref:F-box protein AT5G49610-like beta-propeller domain-containing protein n=1 Tax=Setaria italica TaxID=4555 RepID=K3ZUD6_SETIT|nr:uncharacterized protein LOC111256264 [Setaria italica]RCV09391.1 hypothetical protein SETIT_2G024000v2 [Setaria italica]